ncbi:MAG: FUN14 domain-containing protein [Phycisphaerales bacterium]
MNHPRRSPDGPEGAGQGGGSGEAAKRPSTAGARGSGRPALHGWAIWALVASVLLMVGGLAVPFVWPTGPTGASVSSAPAGVLGLTGGGQAGGDTGTAESPQSTLAAWSPTIFRLGFSFFACFAVGYALRTFFGFAVAALGFFFLALFGLEYAGLIDVKWGLVQERYDALAETAAREARSAWQAASAYIPAGGAGAAGLFSGWRRRVI